MMKTMRNVLCLMTPMLILAACSNDGQSVNEGIDAAEPSEEDHTAQDESNIVFDAIDYTEEDFFMYQSIDDRGVFVETENEATTPGIEYDAKNDYTVSSPATVSYYNEGDFLESHDVKGKEQIETVEGANYINISFSLDDMHELQVEKAD